MASTATTRLRLQKQATGENNNTWGSLLNTTVFDLIDTAIAGRSSFTLSGTKTLSSTNYAADESRAAWIDITSGTGGTVTIPAVEKTYIARNNTSGNVIFTTGSGVTATLPAGTIVTIVCDGTNVYLSEGTIGDVDDNVRAWLIDPTSAKLRASLTDETGTGSAVFATAPTLSNPVVGTQTQGDNSTKAASTAYVDTAVAALAGQWELIETIATTSGNSITFDNIPTTYQDLRLEFLGVSVNAAAAPSTSLYIELSPDAATWTAAKVIAGIAIDATTYGEVAINAYNQATGTAFTSLSDLGSDNSVSTSSIIAFGSNNSLYVWRVSAGITAIRLSFALNITFAFDAGSIKLWGRI